MAEIGDWTFRDSVTLQTEGTDPAHAVTKAYVDAGDSPALVTQEAFTITVDSGGTDPAPGLRVTSQAEADAHGDFLTVGGAVGALYDLLLKHTVTIQLPTGTWNLAAGELDQMWRVTPTWEYFPEVFGMIQIRGDDGWTILAGTTEELAVSSDSAGNIVFASDPFGASDAETQYLYVVSGTGSGQFKPIRTHSGVNATIAGEFSPALDGTSLMRVAKPATKLKFADDVIRFRGGTDEPGDFLGGARLVEFWHLELEATPAIGGWWETHNLAASFDGGVRFNDLGIYANGATIYIGEVIFDCRNYNYQAIDIREGGLMMQKSTKTVYFRGAGASGVLGAIGLAGPMHVAIFCFMAFDDYQGTPLFELYAPGLLVRSECSNSNKWRSDGLASYAVKATKGARFDLFDPSDIVGSTFDGATDSIFLDNVSEVSWAELDAFPDETAVGPFLSIVGRGF